MEDRNIDIRSMEDRSSEFRSSETHSPGFLSPDRSPRLRSPGLHSPDRGKGVRLYNIMLPIWLLIFIPTWLWLILIPLNYLLDRIVLRWSLGDMPEKGLFCRRHTWKICIAGFTSDFIGVILLLGVFLIGAQMDDSSQFAAFFEEVEAGVGFNPFHHWLSLVIVLAAVAVAALLIYVLDRWILKRAGLAIEQAKKSALRLAIITAPYLFLFPSSIIYESTWTAI